MECGGKVGRVGRPGDGWRSWRWRTWALCLSGHCGMLLALNRKHIPLLHHDGRDSHRPDSRRFRIFPMYYIYFLLETNSRKIVKKTIYWSRQHTGHEALGSGHWALDTGHWTLGSGLWTLDTKLWALDTKLWALDSGHWTLALDSGLWTLSSGLWTLDSGLWTLSSGLWTLALDTGLWTLGSGLWPFDTKLWALQTGLCALDSRLWVACSHGSTLRWTWANTLYNLTESQCCFAGPGAIHSH